MARAEAQTSGRVKTAIERCVAPRTREVSARVDLLYETRGILLRDIPGTVDLAHRTSRPNAFSRAAELASCCEALARDELPAFTILKAVVEPGCSLHQADSRCDARVDLALEPAGNIVVLGIEGEWITDGPEAHIHDAAAQVRARLDGFEWTERHVCCPSLCYVSPAPRGVQIEVTTHCNLHCGYCNHRRLSSSAKRHTPLAEIRRILDSIDFSQIAAVDLTGLGEPLLHPRLPEIVAEVRRRAPWQPISVVTNGTVATVERCKPLLDAGLTSLSVSLDSLDASRFNASRAGARFETVKRNVISLARFRESHATRPFELQLKPVLLDESPYEEADRLLKFCAEHRLDKPRFSSLDRRKNTVDRYAADLELRGWPVESAASVAAWVDRRWTELNGELPGIQVPPSDKGELPWVHPDLQPDTDLCIWVHDVAYIGGDGSCIACCQQMGDLPRPHLGSVFEKTLSRLWNDELLYAYRLPLSLGLVPMRCEGCSYAPVEP